MLVGTYPRRSAPSNLAAWSSMLTRNPSWRTLLKQTLQPIPKFALLSVALGLPFAALSVVFDGFSGWVISVATFFGLSFMAAPRAISVLRRKRRLQLTSPATIHTLYFSFFWGAGLAAALVGLLRPLFEIEAAVLVYVVAAVISGCACAGLAMLPPRR